VSKTGGMLALQRGDWFSRTIVFPVHHISRDATSKMSEIRDFWACSKTQSFWHTRWKNNII